MLSEYDFLSIERHEQNEGSHLADIKNLIIVIRYTRDKIPATEIKTHMPPLWNLESKLNSFNESIGQENREWIQEIMVVLDNEPEPDETTSFKVYEILIVGSGESTINDTGISFDQNTIAEEWIREAGTPGIKYTVLKIIEPK